MHFKINEQNLITKFHIEIWDSKGLGEELVTKIENYKNKNYEEFVLFALKNRLFLKLRALFLLDKSESIYFWSCAPIYGESEKEGIKMLLRLDPERNVKIKYAKFYLKGPESIQPQMVSVFYEAGLRQLLEEVDYKSKDFIFELSEDEIKEISLGFNISRNNINGVYILMKKNGDEEELMSGISKEIMFTGLTEKTNELEILTENFVTKISPTDAKKYIGLLPTYTNNKDKQNELIELLKKMKKMQKKWWKFW